MFMSDIPRPLHPAIARQSRQLVLSPFLKIRAGAILELFGDFAIPIGHEAEAFLDLYLAARIVERTIQLTASLLQPTSKFMHGCKSRAIFDALITEKVTAHFAQPVRIASDAFRFIAGACGFRRSHGVLDMADAQHALAAGDRPLQAPNSATSALALVERSMRLF